MNPFKRISYNAPVILTFSLVALAALGLSMLTSGASNRLLFSVYRAPLSNPLTYIRFFGHVIGHGSFQHFLGNFMIILLIGPMLEERYGSKWLLIMMLVTALVTGLIYFVAFPGKALLGASGIVFMLILLSSFTNLNHGKLPLTLIFVIIIYIGQEIVAGLTVQDNVSNLTHLAGGACGAVFGFLMNRDKWKLKADSASAEDIELS